VIVGGMRVSNPKVHHEADVNNNKNKEANASGDDVVEEADKSKCSTTIFFCDLCPQSTESNESGSFKLFSFHTHTHLVRVLVKIRHRMRKKKKKRKKRTIMSIASTLDAFTSSLNPNFI